MPKLDSKTQETVDQAKAWGDGNSLIPDGRYAGRLSDVHDWGKGPSGYDSWSWTFRHLHNVDGEKQGNRRIFHNTSLSPKAAGNLKATYEALGFSLDSDTDEMIGEWAVLYITSEVAKAGKNAGKTVNRVSSISEFKPDEFDFDSESVPADDDETGPTRSTSDADF